VSWRALYEQICDYEGPDLYRDVLRARSFDEERRWLDEFGKRRGSPIPPATPEELWELYALSRVVDMLRQRADIAEFMESLGLQRIEPRPFHPFFHEVVTIAEETTELWPGYMLGPLLIARAGCAVKADFPKEIAERSTLYWAYLRRNRPTNDLSLGWGSNSQWRTSFRRESTRARTLMAWTRTSTRRRSWSCCGIAASCAARSAMTTAGRTATRIGKSSRRYTSGMAPKLRTIRTARRHASVSRRAVRSAMKAVVQARTKPTPKSTAKGHQAGNA
jgi:hypothetical protein